MRLYSPTNPQNGKEFPMGEKKEALVIDKMKYYSIFNGTLLLILCIMAVFPVCQIFAEGQGLPASFVAKLRAEDNPGWKVVWDRKTGVVKRLCNAKSKPFTGKPQDAAKEFLSSYHGLFGLPPDLNNIQIRESSKTPLGERVIFRQYHNGIPVVGAEVTIHVSEKNCVFYAENRCIPLIETDTHPLIEKDAAVQTAENALSVDASMIEKVSAELVILPRGSEQNLAWRMVVSKKGLIDKTWLVYVDAKNGWVIYKKKLQISATGTGDVYRENPLTTPELATMTLNNLTSSSSLLGGTFGKPYNAECFEVVDDTSDLSGFSTASSASRDYRYTNNDIRLEEVMAYYHQTNMHDVLKSAFGFGNLDNQIPMFVNVQDSNMSFIGLDNAFYTRDGNFPSTGFLAFGCGNILNNLGLDADVITHEYGHAVLDHIQPELLENIEHNYGGAIHESVADIIASYFNGNGIIGEWGLTTKDGSQSFSRNMDNTRTYPDDVYEPFLGVSEVHYTGEILNGIYWDIRETAGADTAFGIFFSALYLLAGDATFFDMRDACLTADDNLNNGVNSAIVESAFADHGIEGNDPENTDATLKLKNLVFYKLDPYSGNLIQQKTFQRGDYIVVAIKANIAKLTPAYNIIPEGLFLSGKGSNTFDGFLLYQEALDGIQEYQMALITSNSAQGKIQIKIKVRLGGTGKVKTKTGTFKIK